MQPTTLYVHGHKRLHSQCRGKILYTTQGTFAYFVRKTKSFIYHQYYLAFPVPPSAPSPTPAPLFVLPSAFPSVSLSAHISDPFL